MLLDLGEQLGDVIGESLGDRFDDVLEMAIEQHRASEADTADEG